LFLRSDKHQGSTRGTEPRPAERRDDEGPLIEAARDLDDGAWAEIYARHSREVYAYIYYRVGDQHIAEDLAADVFVRALTGIAGYAWRGTPLLAWLYRIAHNVTVDYHKAAARRAANATDREPELVEDGRNEMDRWDEHTDMMQAIRKLTDDQQQVIILRFYSGMSNAEVSRVVGKPEGAVKALQSRGLRSLRRALTEKELSA
jgi:RNA polymerase sigma-70 factor (ECF subfamily)